MNKKDSKGNQQQTEYEKQEEKEEAEVRNTLTLKSGGEYVSTQF